MILESLCAGKAFCLGGRWYLVRLSDEEAVGCLRWVSFFMKVLYLLVVTREVRVGVDGSSQIEALHDFISLA